MLEGALAKSVFPPKASSRAYWELRRDLPYAVHPTGLDGVRILLNRHYKPLGSNVPSSGERIDYDRVAALHVRLTAEGLARIGATGELSVLFNDGSAPCVKRHRELTPWRHPEVTPGLLINQVELRSSRWPG